MSQSAQINLVQFVKETSGHFIFGVVFLSMLTFPSIWVVGQANDSGFGLAIISVLIFSLTLSLENTTEQGGNRWDELSKWRKAVITLFAISFYNLVIMVSGLLAVVATLVLGPLVGMLVALIYPVWDTYTAKRAIPLSIGGVITATMVTLRVIGALGVRAYELVKTAETAPFLLLTDRKRIG